MNPSRAEVPSIKEKDVGSEPIAGSAVISEGAVLGPRVSVGHGTVVHARVELGEGTTVGEHCVLGLPAGTPEPLRVGPGALIRSHSVLYEGSDIGPGLQTGHHSLIRAGCSVGENLRLGSYSSLEGNLRIGDYVTIAGYTQIGPGAQVGDFAWIFSLVTLTNDPLPPSKLFAPVTIGSGAVVCVGATLLPGVTIGVGAFVAAGATVASDVPNAQVVGRDGRPAGPVDRLVNMEGGIAHPWMSHFTDRYPPEAQERLAELRDEVLAACRSSR